MAGSGLMGRFRSRTARHGSIRGRLVRDGGFSALRCGCAYGGWIGSSGWLRFALIRDRIAVRRVVGAEIVVDFVGVAASNFLDRLVFFFQLSHVAFECGLEF